VCAATLAGCGGSQHKMATSTTSTATGPTHAKPVNHAVATVTDVADGGQGPEKMRLTIYDLRRQGPYVVLDFGVTCLEDPSTGCDLEFAFAPPEIEMNGNNDFNTPSAVALVDPQANKEYLAVRDASGQPNVSQLPSNVYDNVTHLAWVRFPAPTSPVTALDVLFPQGGPQVPNVPITSGSGPVATAGVQASSAAPFDRPPDSTNTTGLTLPTDNLVLTAGNPTGSDQESATRDTLTLRADVLFHFDKSNLTAAAHSILAHVAPQIRARAIGPVQVTGYTDSIGPSSVNGPLSQARAQSVVAALTPLTSGINYQAAGKGAADPVAPNTLPDGQDNPAGRALNRRVTIVFAVRKPTPPTAPPTTGAQTSSTAGSQSRVASYSPSAQNGQGSFNVTVNSVFREGDLAVARMTIACASATSGKCDAEQAFAGTPTVPPQAGQAASSGDSNTISAFYLVDPATGTEYIPVRDSTSGHAVVAGINPNMNPGDSYPVWAYFPAPPASTSTINVELPNGSADVTGVPIGATPPPQP